MDSDSTPSVSILGLRPRGDIANSFAKPMCIPQTPWRAFCFTPLYWHDPNSLWWQQKDVPTLRLWPSSQDNYSEAELWIINPANFHKNAGIATWEYEEVDGWEKTRFVIFSMHTTNFSPGLLRLNNEKTGPVTIPADAQVANGQWCWTTKGGDEGRSAEGGSRCSNISAEGLVQLSASANGMSETGVPSASVSLPASATICYLCPKYSLLSTT
ncbi:hypothetical protein EDD18DRAFT_1101083 [Armillaria luteobubalina]|uniref:Uncharacterized protein n=1 Tax=Armillaria luteobubalina TaxID=153913 RepID=A0AA39QEA3_9AGAR|nr:hypothetical protein EDD18DRAFT_1101083 [Armillaria luteobubalina]